MNWASAFFLTDRGIKMTKSKKSTKNSTNSATLNVAKSTKKVSAKPGKTEVKSITAKALVKSASKQASKTVSKATSAKNLKVATAASSGKSAPVKSSSPVLKATKVHRQEPKSLLNSPKKVEKLKEKVVAPKNVESLATGSSGGDTKSKAKNNVSALEAKKTSEGKITAKVIEPKTWEVAMALKQEISKSNLENHPQRAKSTKAANLKERLKEDADFKEYKVNARFTIGDRLIHELFGRGFVRDVIGDYKIRVSFKDFEKILVHGIHQTH